MLVHLELGEKSLIYSTLLGVAAMARTIEWSPLVGLTMSLCCLFAVTIGRTAIKNRGTEPKLPVNFSHLNYPGGRALHFWGFDELGHLSCSQAGARVPYLEFLY